MKQIIEKSVISRILTVILCLAAWNMAFAATPEETLAKAKTKISGASSLSADFSMKLNGQVISGQIYSKGSKFSISASGNSYWYNGKELYTYDPSKSETVVYLPSASELAQVNPLLYIDSASQFTVAGTKSKTKGMESVALVPKKKGTGIKTVVMQIDEKSYLPSTIQIYPDSGGVIEITLTNIRLNVKLSDSTFEYPKDKYKNTQIIDMR